MPRTDTEAELVDVARRCARVISERAEHVGAVDSWEATARDAADMVGLNVADRDVALALVAGTLVVSQMAAHMLRAGLMSREEYDVAVVPSQMTAGLLLPYVEGRG